MEQHAWRVEFTSIKAHAGQHRNETADQLAKEAANSKSMKECYTKIPKSAILKDLKDHSTKQWEKTTKGAITKLFFPTIKDRLNINLNTSPKFTAITTGHGNIKSYLFKYKIIDNPQCSCKKGEQMVQHIIFECTNFEQEKDRLKAVVLR